MWHILKIWPVHLYVTNAPPQVTGDTCSKQHPGLRTLGLFIFISLMVDVWWGREWLSSLPRVCTTEGQQPRAYITYISGEHCLAWQECSALLSNINMNVAHTKDMACTFVCNKCTPSGHWWYLFKTAPWTKDLGLIHIHISDGGCLMRQGMALKPSKSLHNRGATA